jgi:hypothetical protein
VLTTIWSFAQAWIERKLGASDRRQEPTWRERLAKAWTPATVFRR